MPSRLGWIVACGSLAILASPALGQPSGLRGSGLALGGFHLVADPSVRKELKLDESQVKKADAVAKKMNARFQADMGRLKGLNESDRMKRLPTLAGPHYEEGMRELAAFLTPAQIDRFDQILFQMRGPMAMLEPRIAEVLKLNNGQARQVAELVAQAKNRQADAIKEAKGDPKAAAPRLRAIDREASEKAVALLDDDQRKAWGRLAGDPFDPTAEKG